MPFEFKKLTIEEVILVKPKIFGDERGFFMESYKQSDFVANGIVENFRQDNHSKSIKNVVRGLHFQLNPTPQGKLVRCTQGEIFDVAVDIRKGSPTYGKWVGEILSAENKKMLYVPVGFAHGFSVLSETAEVLYKTTNEYDANLDIGIAYNDPDINIDWEIDDEALISDKDKDLKNLKDTEINFTYEVKK